MFATCKCCMSNILMFVYPQGYAALHNGTHKCHWQLRDGINWMADDSVCVYITTLPGKLLYNAIECYTITSLTNNMIMLTSAKCKPHDNNRTKGNPTIHVKCDKLAKSTKITKIVIFHLCSIKINIHLCSIVINLWMTCTNKMKSLSLLQNLMGFLLKFTEMGYRIKSWRYKQKYNST